ncbi:MAG: DUF2254 domain-containing protein [Planctomycetes bacterium]|nr:DUF2254 domain-containing protein [Planctomycetota bacterium]
MKLKLPSLVSNLVDRVRTSLWFVPALAMVGALVLAGISLRVDAATGKKTLSALPGIDRVGVETAQTILSTLVGSLMTVIGVVFSITVVSLTLASSQFGPRLLRNFLRDRVTQLCFAALLGTFLYSLVVFVAIGGQDDQRFVPEISLAAAVLMAVGSVGVVSYFVHHVGAGIQVSSVVASVADELAGTVESLFPEPIGQPSEDRPADRDVIRAALAVPGVATVAAKRGGYLRVVRTELLMDLAAKHDLVIDLLVRPGAFLVAGLPVMRAVGRRGEPAPAAAVDELAGTLITGTERTSVQDLEFPFDQLVEVALRALSPGINDPRTAINCVDRIGEAIARLSGRRFPSDVRCDEDGEPRVLAPIVSFGALLRTGFVRIARAARRAEAREVTAAIGRALRRVATVTEDVGRRRLSAGLARELAGRRE